MRSKACSATSHDVYNYDNYSTPDRGAEYCDEHVCLSAGVFVCPRSYLRNYMSDLHHVHVTYGRGLVLLWRRTGAAICYVFPVFWITSYLHISWGCSTSPSGWSCQVHLARRNTRCRQRTLGTTCRQLPRWQHLGVCCLWLPCYRYSSAPCTYQKFIRAVG